jgi:hypothetical protein
MSRNAVPRRLTGILFAIAVHLGVVPGTLPGQALTVGEKAPDYVLEGFVLFGEGRTRLRDFYGSVVLIDWWAFHCPACVGGSVPRAAKAEAEFGEDGGFASVLIETEGLPKEALFGFMTTKFPKSRCVVASVQSLELDPPRGGVPHAALIGVDGTVLWHGMPNAQPKKIEDLVRAELRKRISGWGEFAESKKIRALAFGKGKLGDALKLLDAAEGTAKDDKKAELKVVRDEIAARFDVRLRAVSAMLDEGRALDAQSAAAALKRDVRDAKALEAEVEKLSAAFKTPEVERELKADQAFAKLLDGFGAKGPTAAAAPALRAFAKKHEETKVAARAEALAEAVEFDPSKY